MNRTENKDNMNIDSICNNNTFFSTLWLQHTWKKIILMGAERENEKKAKMKNVFQFFIPSFCSFSWCTIKTSPEHINAHSSREWKLTWNFYVKIIIFLSTQWWRLLIWLVSDNRSFRFVFDTFAFKHSHNLRTSNIINRKLHFTSNIKRRTNRAEHNAEKVEKSWKWERKIKNWIH